MYKPHLLDSQPVYACVGQSDLPLGASAARSKPSLGIDMQWTGRLRHNTDPACFTSSHPASALVPVLIGSKQRLHTAVEQGPFYAFPLLDVHPLQAHAAT